MTQLLEYIIKLSGTLIIFYLFYWLVLSRLTFYTANRWYLLGYSIAAFLIPLINIGPILEQEQISSYEILQWVPIVEATALKTIDPVQPHAFQWNTWSVLLLILCIGSLLMLARFIVQYNSVVTLRRASRLISDGEVKVYQVHKNIVPFSFGNSIFINQPNHTEVELQDIIRHEFIHVQQKHTLDIIVSEWLCILNWYNPFAWLIRNAVRQNLEFIADNKVIQDGVDKKQYQYLLLKVIGEPHYSIATNFNFTSLKKRITMMNKMRSAKMHIIKFLFVLPLMAFILLAFRNSGTESNSPATATSAPVQIRPGVKEIFTLDTVPAPPKAPVPVTPNSKGYLITVADNHGECIVIVKDKQNKIVRAVSLVEWDENENNYKSQYGEITGAIPAKFSATKTETNSGAEPSADKAPSPTPAPPYSSVVMPTSDDISAIHVDNKVITITLKNGETEKYDLKNPQHKAVFEEKYGKNATTTDQRPRIMDSLSITDRKPGKPGTVVIGRNQKSSETENSSRKPGEKTDPLLLLDGKEYTENTGEILAKLDPNSIESVEVLKDEAARQKYGEKAKYGVVKVTSKPKPNKQK